MFLGGSKDLAPIEQEEEEDTLVLSILDVYIYKYLFI